MIVLLLLVLLSIGAGFISQSTIFVQYRIKAQHTATVQAQNIHSAQLQATGEAQERATADALARLQANYDLITSTRPAINDQMHGPDLYKWDTDTGCAFKDGGYHVAISQKGSFIPCLAKGTKFSNFVYQVRMKILKGDAGGIVFRATQTNSQSYLFNVGQDGSYSVYYYPGDASGTTRTITHGFSNLLATGLGQENLLGVIARKNMLDLYINKKYLTSFQDVNLTVGRIGIIANDNQNNTEVVCIQAQVWNL
ncbi:MAG: hypothetical protein NVS2B12_03540 [Ktedonobacteraceae bacterium]